jgi:hypothetical protein
MMRHRFTIRVPALTAIALIATLSVTALRAEEEQQQPDASRVFRAGAAKSNVTPPLDLPIIGGWSSPPAGHVHDELYAKCIVLDNSQTRLALVIVDNIGMGADVCDAAKRSIQQHTGIPPSHVLIAGTHTHSSVSARNQDRLRLGGPLDDYQQFLASRIADGVRRAVNNLEPARIGWGRAEESTQVFNRRYYMKPGTPTPNPFGGVDQVVMNPGRANPNILKAAGPIDPEIAFLSLQSSDGRPLALLANYSLHYVGPSAGSVISADYFGVFGDRIQQLLGADRLDPPFVGIMSNGTSADINNINWLKKPDKKWAPYEKMRQVADLVARRVVQAHQTIEFHDWVPLAAATEPLALAVRKPSDELLAHMREVQAKPADAKPYHRHEKVYAQRVLGQQQAPDQITVTLQALRIGDLGVCALPFEVFVEIGLQVKAESPLAQTFVVSHANGTYGYLPTVRQHELGGYETWMGTNMVETKAASKIVDRLLVMLASLK